MACDPLAVASTGSLASGFSTCSPIGLTPASALPLLWLCCFSSPGGERWCGVLRCVSEHRMYYCLFVCILCTPLPHMHTHCACHKFEMYTYVHVFHIYIYDTIRCHKSEVPCQHMVTFSPGAIYNIPLLYTSLLNYCQNMHVHDLYATMGQLPSLLLNTRSAGRQSFNGVLENYPSEQQRFRLVKVTVRVGEWVRGLWSNVVASHLFFVKSHKCFRPSKNNQLCKPQAAPGDIMSHGS